MRLRHVFVGLVLVAGCHRTLDVPAVDFGPGDALVHPDNDGSLPVDVSSASCQQIVIAIASWVGDHRACVRDEDCAFVPTVCELPDWCQSYYNRSADGPYLQSLEHEFFTRPCIPYPFICASCVNGDRTAKCSDGICIHAQ
jgi:hypothetical protein